MRAVRASTQRRGHVDVYCGPMYKVRAIMMIVFCFLCFRCPAVCSALLPTSVTLNASQTYAYARHAHNCLRGHTVENRGVRAGAILCSSFVCFYCFTLLLPVYFCFFLGFCVLLYLQRIVSFFTFIGSIFLMKCVLLLLVFATVPCLPFYFHSALTWS
ncbi:mucin-associated surface protein (MASP) [Trypanosoma cruzi]|nr:mucin-associated surface protein (MASP) [Trypanosoma cruzi]